MSELIGALEDGRVVPDQARPERAGFPHRVLGGNAGAQPADDGVVVHHPARLLAALERAEGEWGPDLSRLAVDLRSTLRKLERLPA